MEDWRGCSETRGDEARRGSGEKENEAVERRREKRKEKWERPAFDG
jgi:hypothetical protein